MNGSALAPGLLFASLGLLLSFSASRRVIVSSIISTLAITLVATALPIGFGSPEAALTGCWIGVIAAAACMHLRRPIGYRVAVPLCVNGGLWAALTIALSGKPIALVPDILWVLLAFPGTRLVSRGNGIIIKVVGTWLAVAAVLSLGLNMTATLGYEPDHME